MYFIHILFLPYKQIPAEKILTQLENVIGEKAFTSGFLEEARQIKSF